MLMKQILNEKWKRNPNLIMSEKIEVTWNPGKSFVCVDYPAVVENVDKMLETVGGAEAISKIYNNPGLRLPVRFRPDDVYCKPLYGDKVNVARILLKVRRPKVPQQEESSANNQSTSSKCQVEMLGIVDRTYKFKSMADFQYLAMVKSENGEGHRPIYDDVVPTMMHPLAWLNEPVPMFLPPIVCSRMDTPCDYDFRKDVVVEREREDVEQDVDTSPRIGHNRRKRCGFAIYAKFDQENLPNEPLPGCLKQIRERGFTQEQIEELQEVFKSRPVWSKLAVKTQLKGRNLTLSYLLPGVAFYMVTGPWRTLWIRYGFDPRKEPTAKIYQMIDLRLTKFGSSIPLYSKWRGTVYGASAKISPHISDKVSLIHKEDLIGKEAASGSSQLTQAEVEEKSKYSFYDGVLPNRRQSILQFCDIYIDEVQRLLHENDGREDKCTEKEGWFADGFASRCRQLLFNSIESSIASADTGQTAETESRNNNNDSEQSSEDYEDDGE